MPSQARRCTPKGLQRRSLGRDGQGDVLSKLTKSLNDVQFPGLRAYERMLSQFESNSAHWQEQMAGAIDLFVHLQETQGNTAANATLKQLAMHERELWLGHLRLTRRRHWTTPIRSTGGHV